METKKKTMLQIIAGILFLAVVVVRAYHHL